jgi:hypothetical protein
MAIPGGHKLLRPLPQRLSKKLFILLDTTRELLYFFPAFGAHHLPGQRFNSSTSRFSNPSPIGRPLPIVCSHGKGFSNS